MPDDKPRTGVLTSATLVPLGASIFGVITIIGGAVASYAWLDDQFDGLRTDVGQIKDRVGAMQEVLADRWTVSQQKTWAELLSARNPGLSVPPVEK